MRSLARAIEKPNAVGRQIKLPWLSMRELVDLRTKELVLVAGAPGSGKSTFLINMVMLMDEPVLYLAQDSAPSVTARMAALATTKTVDQVKIHLESPSLRPKLVAEVGESRPELIINSGAVNLDGLAGRVDALVEWLGRPPAIVVVDNLIDLMVEGFNHSDMGFYAKALTTLKQMALDLDCAMMCLHHVTRRGFKAEDLHGIGKSPLKLNDLLYAGEREARHVWGLYNDGEGSMTVQVLKQQDGAADPEGNLRFDLGWEPRYGRVYDRMGGR